MRRVEAVLGVAHSGKIGLGNQGGAHEGWKAVPPKSRAPRLDVGANSQLKVASNPFPLEEDTEDSDDDEDLQLPTSIDQEAVNALFYPSQEKFHTVVFKDTL